MLEASDAPGAVAAVTPRSPSPAKRPAHRPSRRREIIEAATVVFSTEGYGAANLEDIARAAGVAPTALYYHFGSKEELFNQALRSAMAGLSDAIFVVRPDDAPGGEAAFRDVLRAGWDYWYSHQDAARLVARYSDSSTAHAARLRAEWEERHLERAYDYLSAGRASRSTKKAREQHAAHTLALRVMMGVIFTTQAPLLEGAFGRASRAAVADAAATRCLEIIGSVV